MRENILQTTVMRILLLIRLRVFVFVITISNHSCLLTLLCSFVFHCTNSCYFPGGLYCGGSAVMVEKALGFHGDETLYVGDHIYTDVSMSKVHLRWRTALICRELEKEVIHLSWIVRQGSICTEIVVHVLLVGERVEAPLTYCLIMQRF